MTREWDRTQDDWDERQWWLTQVHEMPEAWAEWIVALERRVLSLEQNVADHEQKVGRLLEGAEV
jgi:hypothetical protein